MQRGDGIFFQTDEKRANNATKPLVDESRSPWKTLFSKISTSIYTRITTYVHNNAGFCLFLIGKVKHKKVFILILVYG